MENFLQHIGQKVRGIRASNGMSQKALADHVGIEQATVSLIEQGKSHVKIGVLYKIASHFGVGLRYFDFQEPVSEDADSVLAWFCVKPSTDEVDQKLDGPPDYKLEYVQRRSVTVFTAHVLVLVNWEWHYLRRKQHRRFYDLLCNGYGSVYLGTPDRWKIYDFRLECVGDDERYLVELHKHRENWS